MKPVSYQSRPSFVLRRVRGLFAYEKTMRALQKRFADGTFRPTFSRDAANFNFREMIIRPHYGGKFLVHLPNTFDDWQDLFDWIFKRINFNREALIHFTPAARAGHARLIRDQLENISVIENWLFYNKNILNELIDNF
ncbi:hypothetical protein A3K32_01735 [candidate division WOR-1 bacterium RIFOXYB2_FULL_45_9]|nr:MAG: hypothetical protein A3K32_01735 [candidate division WOR-1 bacterium RIFOXYB2_FULL_45_9]OGC29988.1 MAG: hypothetical protein A2346_04595 [candidate division WOR-1 bacterium RIFOXYB12_FULL_52_16]